MDTVINFIKLSIKGAPIGGLAALSDLGSMFLMGKFTELDIKYQVYISSFLGMIVSFWGSYLWTFKGSKSPSSRKIKFIKFMISHVTFTIICSEITVQLIKYLNRYISEMKDKSTLIDAVSTGGKLSNISNTFIKGSVNSLFYFVNIFIMKFIF